MNMMVKSIPEEIPVDIFCDVPNLTTNSDWSVPSDNPVTKDFVRPDFYAYPFKRDLIEKIKCVTGSSRIQTFKACLSVPWQPHEEIARAEFRDQLWRVEQHLKSEVPISCEVEILHEHQKDIDSLMVGTLWARATMHLLTSALLRKALPAPLHVAIVSGDGIFIKTLTQMKGVLEGAVDLRFHIFSYEQSLNRKANRALKNGDVQSITLLTPPTSFARTELLTDLSACGGEEALPASIGFNKIENVLESASL